MALPSKYERPRAVWLSLRRRIRWRQPPLIVRRSLRVQLQWSHLIASLLPLLALGIVLLYSNAIAAQRMVAETQSAAARSVAADVSDILLQAEYDLLNFGRNQLQIANRAALQQQADAFVDQHAPHALGLHVLDRQGNTLAFRAASAVEPPIAPQNEAFFGLASQGWTHISLTTSARGRHLLQVAAPVRQPSGYIDGVAVALLSTQQIERRLQSLPRNIARSVFLVDQSGTVLLGQPHATLQHPDVLAQWSASTNALAHLEGTDRRSISAARALVAPGGWFVVVEQPADVAYGAQRRETLLLVVMLCFTTGLVIWWGLTVARRMTRPIRQLHDGVVSLGAGQLGGTIAIERDDELGDLAREFNRMSARLAESQRTIEQRNERLAQSEHVLKQQNRQLREGLQLARLVQRDLLPNTPPVNAPIVACAVTEPASEVGGDFYTYVSLPDGRLRLIIGDASGKGVAAALVMALTSSLVDVHARQEIGPGALMRLLNAELTPRFHINHMSVALLIAEFDPRTQQICVANAGMIAPLLASRQRCEYLLAYGPPLGVVDNVSFNEVTLQLTPDDVVVFVSDGIIEARDRVGEMWGFRRFETAVCRAAASGPQAIVHTIVGAVRQHTRHSAPADDLTIIATSVLPRKDQTAPPA
jgi:serine phosphatase RsbU (regulator of sigma subunit)